VLFRRFFSTDNPKAIKAQKLGWLNSINYMAPHRLAAVGNLCPNASTGCIALCLGEHSGNAALYPTVLKSRIAKARYFMRDRQAFMLEMANHIAAAGRRARKAKLKLCVRLNGARDIAWESIKMADGRSVVDAFPDVQFVDYTKSLKRALAHARSQFPANYHLTFSRSETNEAQCPEVLAAGGNVAVVFAGAFPAEYLGHRVIDGDKSDLRHRQARPSRRTLAEKDAKRRRTNPGLWCGHDQRRASPRQAGPRYQQTSVHDLRRCYARPRPHGYSPSA
jgi:hypothetical protein